MAIVVEGAKKVRVKRKVRRRVRRRAPAWLGRLLPAILVAAIVSLFLVQDDPISRLASPGRRALTLNDQLFDIVPNTWAKLRVGRVGAWPGEGQAGAVFDSRRKKVFVFGSDFDGRVWDNTVHEFDPAILQWSSHAMPSRRPTYRLDEQGRPVAGEEALRPWAMQVHGGLVYDPALDALVVVATPADSPALRRTRGPLHHPVWIYELGPRRWRPMGLPEDQPVAAEGSAAAYDAGRDVVVVHNRAGLWELGPERSQWILASGESHHRPGDRLSYDGRGRYLAVFGGEEGIWTYSPGPEWGRPGTWQHQSPGGDACLQDPEPAVAFDSDNGVFLLVLDQDAVAEEEGRKASAGEAGGPTAAQAVPVEGQGMTCLYDPQANVYRRLPEAAPPVAGRPHVLVYDPVYKVFFLMGKDSGGKTSVWVMSLEPALLDV